MKNCGILILAAALVGGCGSPDSRETAADRVTNTRAAPKGSVGNIVTIPLLQAKLNACSAEAGCHMHSILEALWTRGYCRTSSEGTIAKCTAEEIADDRRTTAAFGG